MPFKTPIQNVSHSNLTLDKTAILLLIFKQTRISNSLNPDSGHTHIEYAQSGSYLFAKGVTEV